MPTRSERKLWRSLRRRKGRDETGWFLAEGPRLLDEALRSGAGVVAVLYASGRARDPAVHDLLTRAESAGHRVEEVARRVIEEIADAESPQPVLAVLEIPRWSWDDAGGAPLVLLDGVQDPGNAGGLTRTAVALGAAAVIGLDGCASFWTPKAVRASAGTGLRRPVFRTSRAEAIAEIGRRGLPIWVAVTDGEPVARRGERARDVAIVLGHEVRGVSEEVTAAAARRVTIPMPGGTESLNVAHAGAILLDRIYGP